MSEKQEQQNTERSRMLGTMEMRKLVPTVSVPIMVSMLVQALYNIVDGIFCRAVFAGCADGRQPRYADADADDCRFDRHGYGHQQLDFTSAWRKAPA